MKKVLFVATVESHILFFHIPFIKYFQQKGYEVHVATKLDKRENEFDDLNVIKHNIDFERAIFSRNTLISTKQMIKLIKDNDFSLIHVHTPIAAFITRYAAKKVNFKPVLYTAHGFHFYKGAPLKYWLTYYLFERLAAHWTDGLITINDEDYKMAKKFKIREKNAAYYVKGVGIDLEKYNLCIGKDEIRKKLGYKQDDIIIITVAELIPRKNYIQAIEAIDKLKHIENLKYIIVGYGPQEQYLKDYIKMKNLEDKIKLLGYCENIPELMEMSDIFILMSLHEGLPKCIMEAMAAGLPVIATNVRGNRDLVINQITGYIVNVGDISTTAELIERMINDDSIRNRMKIEALKSIQAYDVNNVLKQMKKIYERYE